MKINTFKFFKKRGCTSYMSIVERQKFYESLFSILGHDFIFLYEQVEDLTPIEKKEFFEYITSNVKDRHSRAVNKTASRVVCVTSQEVSLFDNKEGFNFFIENNILYITD